MAALLLRLRSLATRPSMAGTLAARPLMTGTLARPSMAGSLARPSSIASSIVGRPQTRTLCTETYSQRMDKTGRPISPHVFIYAFPTIAISSIIVRITGGFASFGFFGVGGLALFGGSEFAIDSVQSLTAIAPPFAKFTMAYLLSYQWFGSARHLYWDWTAKGFTNQTMLHSAYGLMGITTVFSLALAMYSLPPPKKGKE